MSNPESEKPTVRSGQHPGSPESRESIETFPLRTKPPGKVGLANEVRPGLGTRAVDAKTGQSLGDSKKPASDGSTKDNRNLDQPLRQPPAEPHEPSEQDSDSLAQEQQRSSGVSGHSGGT